MEYSSVYQDICANCGYEFIPEFQTKTKQSSFTCNKHQTGTSSGMELDGKEIQIVDAILYIFGLSFHDMYPRDAEENHVVGGVSLCSDCVPMMKKLYDSFKDLKRASRKNSILWNSVKWTRNRIGVKNEFPLEDLENRKVFQCSTNTAGDLKREVISEDYVEENESQFHCEANSVQIPQMFYSDDFFDGNNTMDDPLASNNEPITKYDSKSINNNQMDKKTFPTNIRRRKQTRKTSRFTEKLENEKIQSQHRRLKFKKGVSKTGVSSEQVTKCRKDSIETEEGETVRRNLLWEVKHLDSLAGSAPIKCCGTLFQTDVEFSCHVNLIHEKDGEKPEEECQLCGRKILSKYMDFHMKVLHGGKLMVFECKCCKKTFPKEWQLVKHRKTEDHKNVRSNTVIKQRKKPPQGVRSKRWELGIGIKKSEAKVFCEKCGKYFTYEYFTRYHSDIHEEGRKYQCEFCGKNLISKQYLQTHISFYHSINDAKRYCDKCGKCCANRKALSKHKKIHEADLVTDKEKFKCTQCGIMLKHTASMKKHMYMVHGRGALKSFSCEICGKTTKNMTNMRIHMKVHDPNRDISKISNKNTMESDDTPFTPSS